MILNPQAVISNVDAATLKVLKAAAKATSVERVVLTSSIVAAVPSLMSGNESGNETVDVGKCNDMFFVGNELTFSPLRYLEPCVCQSSLGP